LEPVEVRYGHRSLSIAAGDRCVGAVSPDGALSPTGCSDGAAITGDIRAAFQMVEPAHGLQKRGETVRAFPVQAIALGKQVVVLALSGEAALPEGVNPRGLIFAPFSNEAVAAPPQDARLVCIECDAHRKGAYPNVIVTEILRAGRSVRISPGAGALLFVEAGATPTILC
jgi:hypothetical protein